MGFLGEIIGGFLEGLTSDDETSFNEKLLEILKDFQDDEAVTVKMKISDDEMTITAFNEDGDEVGEESIEGIELSEEDKKYYNKHRFLISSLIPILEEKVAAESEEEDEAEDEDDEEDDEIEVSSDKVVSQEELVEKYSQYCDKNLAMKLLVTLRKSTRDKPKLISGATGAIVAVLGKLISAFENPATPSHLKALIVGGIGYIVLPVDLIPDMIPALGYTDDLGSAAGIIPLIASYSDFSLEQLDEYIDSLEENSDEAGETEETEGSEGNGASSTTNESVEERLLKVRKLLDSGLINEEEFKEQKAKILSEL